MSPEPNKETLEHVNLEKLEGSFFWERYKLWIIAVIFAGLVAAIFYTYIRVTKASLNTKAQAFFDAQQTTEDLQKVVDQYPGTPASAQALIFIGGKHYFDQEWDKAINAYNKFLQSFPKHDFASNALMGLGAVYEAKGELDMALAQYKKVYEQYPQSYRAAEARLAVGQVYERKGMKAQAKQAYESVPAAHPQSVWRNFAVEQAKRLEIEKKSG